MKARPLYSLNTCLGNSKLVEYFTTIAKNGYKQVPIPFSQSIKNQSHNKKSTNLLSHQSIIWLFCCLFLWSFQLQANKKEVSDNLFFVCLPTNADVFFQPSRQILQIEGINYSKWISDYGLSSISRPFAQAFPEGMIYLFEIEKSLQSDAFLADLQDEKWVVYTEQVPIYRHFQSTDWNDPAYKQGKQWYLDQINAPEAWAIGKGNNDVSVAIIDDAILTNHEDLAGVMIKGYDFADKDDNPSPPRGATDNCFSHGSHCAGIVAALSDNKKGISSLGTGVTVMPLKCKPDGDLHNDCEAFTFAYQALEHAVNNNADVVSMSFGGPVHSRTWQNLINMANGKGMVLVAAAGNDNTEQVMYPAAYNGVISVGAVDKADKKAYFSNYGTSVDIMAPGTEIWSTLGTHKSAYGYKQGTSMACPIVASLAALMLSYDTSLSPSAIEKCIKSTAVDIEAKNGAYRGKIGAGRLDAGAAMRCLVTDQLVDFEADKTTACPNTPITFTDKSTGEATAWLWEFSGANPSSSTSATPVVQYLESGTYSVELTITNEEGKQQSKNKTTYIQITQPTASIHGQKTIAPGSSANLTVHFEGSPPYTFTYSSDQGGSKTLKNIESTPYTIKVQPSQTTTYQLESMKDADCSGTVSGTALVTINDCLNGVGERVADITTEAVEVTCTGAGLSVEVNICNIGAVDVPSNTAISLYDGDPSLVAARLTHTFRLKRPIGAGKCVKKVVDIPYQEMAIYIVGNDEGQAIEDLPFSDFPSTAIGECDYSNNKSQIAQTAKAVNKIDAGVDKTICVGDSVQLVADGAKQYQWEPAIGLDDPNIANPIAHPDQTTTYIVTAIDEGNCISSDTLTVYVSPLPSLPPLQLDTTICTGNLAIFQLTNIRGISNYRYHWSPAYGLSDPTIPNPIVRLDRSQTYTLTIFNQNGCYAQTAVNVSLDFTAPIPFDLGLNQHICKGESFRMDLSDKDAAQYLWWPEDGSLSCIHCPNPTISPKRSAWYYAAFTDANNCVQVDSFYVNLQEAKIDWPTDTTFCAGESLELSPGDFSSYRWLDGSTSNSIEIYQSGRYTVTVSDQWGCQSSKAIRVQESQVTTPTINGLTRINRGDSTLLEVSGDWLAYIWSTGDTTTNIWGKQPGDYKVTLIDANGCLATTSSSIEFRTPEEITLPTAFSPNGDGINDAFRLPYATTNLSLTIIDRWGNAIFQQSYIDSEQPPSWDGMTADQYAPMGVYRYYFVWEEADGEERVIEGEVFLVR